MREVGAGVAVLRVAVAGVEVFRGRRRVLELKFDDGFENCFNRGGLGRFV